MFSLVVIRGRTDRVFKQISDSVVVDPSPIRLITPEDEIDYWSSWLVFSACKAVSLIDEISFEQTDVDSENKCMRL